jgi:hypothetical protein
MTAEDRAAEFRAQYPNADAYANADVPGYNSETARAIRRATWRSLADGAEPIAAEPANIPDPITTFSTAELRAMADRAYLAAVREWRDVRAYDRQYRVTSMSVRARLDAAVSVETYEILVNAARSADAFHAHLTAEIERRERAENGDVTE